MMWRRASLNRRLLLGAGAFITVALVVAGVVLYFILHRFIQGQVDQRLDTQIVFLTSMLRVSDGNTISVAGSADGPPFDRVRRGWYWQVTGPNNTLLSRSLAGAELDLSSLALHRPPPPNIDRRADAPPPPGDRPRPGDGAGPEEQPLHFRIQPVTISGLPVTIVASAPRAAVLGPLRGAMTTLALSLLVLGASLILAMLAQVRLGLRPLERLRGSLADVRAGRSAALSADQPTEVQPLVGEINALLTQSAANLERARRHTANLAHGLKTPLATLALALPQGSKAQEMRELVELMDRRIRHHLGRARAAVIAGPARAQTAVAPRISDLCSALAKINADKTVAITFDIPADLAVACEPQDFDEIAGNLLENAYRWTKSRITIEARATDKHMRLVMTDDGPGIASEQMMDALKPGQRLDEQAPGFGFGLSIARELAELYGGALDLSAADHGGLRVTITLPQATPA